MQMSGLTQRLAASPPYLGVLLDTGEQMPMRSAQTMPPGRNVSLKDMSRDAVPDRPDREEKNGWLLRSGG
jgi:hypothetical protein